MAELPNSEKSQLRHSPYASLRLGHIRVLFGLRVVFKFFNSTCSKSPRGCSKLSSVTISNNENTPALLVLIHVILLIKCKEVVLVINFLKFIKINQIKGGKMMKRQIKRKERGERRNYASCTTYYYNYINNTCSSISKCSD